MQLRASVTGAWYVMSQINVGDSRVSEPLEFKEKKGYQKCMR